MTPSPFTKEFSEPLLDLPLPPDSYQKNFSKMEGASLLPERESEPPFAPTEFASALGLSSISTRLLFGFPKRDEFQTRFEDTIKQTWETAEKNLAQSIGKDPMAADWIWDSSVIAEDPVAVERDLSEHQIRLENLTPFRLLCFEIESKKDNRGMYLYITQGLSGLYGQEFWCGFSHPMPTLVWFFLKLASYDSKQAPWIRSFQVMGSDSSLSLGEPRSWWAAYLPTPLFGRMEQLFDEANGAQGTSASNPASSAPLHLLFLSRVDLLFLFHFGLPAFFSYLGENQISWYNNLKRAIERT